jgi:hypothetical protein
MPTNLELKRKRDREYRERKKQAGGEAYLEHLRQIANASYHKCQDGKTPREKRLSKRVETRKKRDYRKKRAAGGVATEIVGLQQVDAVAQLVAPLVVTGQSQPQTESTPNKNVKIHEQSQSSLSGSAREREAKKRKRREARLLKQVQQLQRQLAREKKRAQRSRFTPAPLHVASPAASPAASPLASPAASHVPLLSTASSPTQLANKTMDSKKKTKIALQLHFSMLKNLRKGKRSQDMIALQNNVSYVASFIYGF